MQWSEMGDAKRLCFLMYRSGRCRRKEILQESCFPAMTKPSFAESAANNVFGDGGLWGCGVALLVWVGARATECAQ